MAEGNDDGDDRNRGPERPLSQPRPSRLKCRFAGVGGGGICAGPPIEQCQGAPDQSITTITVVICMMRSALPLDS